MSTSAQALATVTASGLITQKQLVVYRLLGQALPSGMTGREIDEALHDADAHKRLPELKAMGVVRQNGKRACKVSGLRVIEWVIVPDADPRPLPPRGAVQPSGERIRALVQDPRLHSLLCTHHPDVMAWLQKLASG